MRAATLTALAVAVAFAVAYVYVRPRAGDIIEAREAETATQRVRIEAREEICGGYCLPGAYYAFLSSARDSSGRWRKIMTFRHDDPVPIPRDNIHFVGDRIAYVFMGWMYAVSTDNGTNWTVWNAQEELPEWECCNYGRVKSVDLAADGTGTMTLKTIPDRNGEVPALFTTDFGKRWYTKAPEQ